MKRSHYILVVEIILICILHAVKIGGKGEFLKTNDLTHTSPKKAESPVNSSPHSSTARQIVFRIAGF